MPISPNLSVIRHIGCTKAKIFVIRFTYLATSAMLVCVHGMGVQAATPATRTVTIQEKVTVSKAAFVGTIEQVMFLAGGEPPASTASGREAWIALGRVRLNELLFGVGKRTQEVYVVLPAAEMKEDQMREAFAGKQYVFFGALEPAPRRWNTTAALLTAAWWNKPEPISNLGEVKEAIEARFPDRPANIRRGGDLVIQSSSTDSIRLVGEGDSFDCNARGYENVDKVVIAELGPRRLCRFDTPGPEPARWFDTPRPEPARSAMVGIQGRTVSTYQTTTILEKVNGSNVIFVGKVERVVFAAGNKPPAATADGRTARVAYAVARVDEVLIGAVDHRAEVYAGLPGIDKDEEQMRRTYGGRRFIFFGHLVPSPRAWNVSAAMLTNESRVFSASSPWNAPESDDKLEEVRKAVAARKSRAR